MYFLDGQKTLVSEVAVWKAPVCVTVTVPVFRTQVTIDLCSSGGPYLEKFSLKNIMKIHQLMSQSCFSRRQRN